MSNDVGKSVLIAGYGTTGLGSATTDPSWADWGWGHFGYNTADVTSKVFLDAWAADGPGVNTYGDEYVYDFDNETASNNTLQRVANVSGNLWTSSTGLGANEALTAGGDSGPGDFVWNGSEWLLSGVHSWGWQFCDGRISPSCDWSVNNSSSYGDLSGSTAMFRQVDWINSVVAVPEPETYALMLLGLAVVGAVARRKTA